MNLAAVSAFAKAPVDQAVWAQAIVGIIIVSAVIVACVLTPVAAEVTGVIAAFWTGVAFAATSPAIVAAVAADEAISKGEREVSVVGNQSKITQTHGEYFANDWNYQEMITTDFDDDTKVCKKCVSSRKCKETAWHIFSDRTCRKWASEGFENKKCTEIQF